ncbi:MAG TPA: hypothetical protein VMR52_11675 [Dehalococcoidia bacterium]|nr:hypothetical protein [Dehalococcoidia bacterium]
MALRFLERELRRLLHQHDRPDLLEAGQVALTDDGGTIYVHLLPRPGWPGRAQGRAYVLAYEDYPPPGSDVMFCYRWLMGEARTSLRENITDIARWLEGK